jgi:curved DNA-binding protein
MAGKDYYQILGVPRTADEKQIRQAYRRLARKHHPDVNPNDKAAAEKFKEIQNAYEVLSDPEKRKKYDQFGEAWQYAEQGGPGFGAGYGRPSYGRGAPGQQGSGGAGRQYEFRYGTGGMDEAFDLGDIFGRMFGGLGEQARTGARMATKGQDIEQPVEITLEEAYRSTQRILEVRESDGRLRRLEVKIPAGVTEGSRVRIAGEGSPGRGGRGDLYMVVKLLPHSQFERKGDDLYTEVSVPLTQAMLGGEVEVPTLKGRVALKIPPETQNGRAFRLAGQGMPHLGGSGHGDLHAKVRVVLPTHLSTRERELFEELQRLRTAGVK